MKKVLALILALAMTLGMISCGGSGTGKAVDVSAGADASAAADRGDANSGASLRLYNTDPVLDGAVKELAAAYEEQTGVHVEVETVSGDEAQERLEQYRQDNNMPDLFSVASNEAYESWKDLAADMDEEAWASDTDFAYVDKEYGVIGFPYTVEAFGLAYNASILEKAGIDPAALTGPKAIEDAFAAIDQKKEELGIKAVVGWYTERRSLWSATGNDMFGNYLDAGLARDDTTYVSMLNNDGGQFDMDRLTDFAEFIAVLNQYSDFDKVISGSYEEQVSGFAAGDYAFVTQGSWIGADMVGQYGEQYADAGNFECGMVPCAFEDGIDTILASSPAWWSVYKDGNTEEAMRFLEWCASEEGQHFLVEGAGCVSPFKSCLLVSDAPFAQIISDYIAAGKTSAWHWQDLKEDLRRETVAPVFTDFARGDFDTQGFIDALQQAVSDYYAQQ